MCISPSYVWVERGSEWEKLPVACRNCWSCRRNRVNDYVGRSMAEMAYSQATCAITLTYGPRDDLADKVLTPRHFQLFMKRLRRAGHKVRYLVVGEYGGLKGRSHFHALLFFQHLKAGEVVPFYNRAYRFASSPSAPFSDLVPNKTSCHVAEWPHGHVKCDWSADERAARYVCKYLLADDKDNAWFSLSKKPALGAAFFADKAAKAKELGVLPASFNYLPPNGNKDRPYLMTGASRRDYLAAITTDPARRPQMGEWIQKAFDKDERARAEKAAQEHPAHEVDKAYQDLYNRRAELEAARQRRDNERINAYYDEAITANNGPIYKKELQDGFEKTQTPG